MRIGRDVLEVLDRATIKGDRVVLNGQLPRDLYLAVNKVLDAAGGKWNRSAGAHIFAGDVEATLEQVILTGEIISAKQEFGAFFTPPDVVDMVMDLADIGDGMWVLEPSAGVGALALAARAAGGQMTCYDILPAHVAALVADGFEATQADFLQVSPERHTKFDRVVMNPPFARQADVLHVMHAAHFLCKDGILVAVMSASVKFRDNALGRSFRGFVESRRGAITDLPEGSFKASGTSVNTALVMIRG